MFVGRKIRLLPTAEQEVLFWRSAGTYRWAYNYYLGVQERAYQAYLERGKIGKRSVSEGVIRKQINNELKPTTHQWLKEIGSNVMKQGVKEADKAMKAYLQGKSGRPRYKAKHKTKPKFYVNYETLMRKNGGFRGEKIGFVRTSEPLPKLPRGQKYSNPWISFDGKYWYLGFSYDVPLIQVKLTGESIGIDLGLTNLATCYARDKNEAKIFPNINKSKEIHRLEKKLRREQRKQDRKLRNNIAKYQVVQGKGKMQVRKPVWRQPLHECHNIERQRRKIALIYRRLTNIRNNHIHKTIAAIVKTKPSRIVLEDLNVQGMMKNRHLAKAIANELFFEFRRQMTYKCNRYGIHLVVADRFYPSSKTCSSCGYLKKDLQLVHRMYRCPCCGVVIDRDVNAAINLANYSEQAVI